MLVRSLMVVGAAAVLGALLALPTPVHLHSVDRGGNPIPCGSGLQARYEVAREQDQINLDENLTRGPAFVASDYADQCATLLLQRRSVAVPVGAIGAFALLLAIAVPFVRLGLDRHRRHNLFIDDATPRRVRWTRHRLRDSIMSMDWDSH